MIISKEKAVYQYANDLGGIELLDANYHKQNFSRHSHEGYTIGVIESGAQRFFRTGSDHVAPQHSIILVNADEVHNGCSATDNGWAYRAMYPLPSLFENISKELGLDQGAPYFPQAVVHDKHLAQMLRLTFTTLNESSNRLLRETLIYSVMVKLMSRHGKAKLAFSQSQISKKHLFLVKQFLDENPAANISLEDLANLAGISACHLLRQFQQSFGLPPHTYQIQSRLRMSKKLIRQGFNILDVALDCGFHDQSHFHRHFKRAMGITPGKYAKAVGANSIQ